MNRLKLWAFALLVLAAGAIDLYLATQWLARSAVAGADRALQSAAAQLDARSQLLAAQASALAEAAARAPAVLAALSEDGEGDAAAAAAVAVAAAARGMPSEQAQGLLVGASGPDGTALRAGGKKVEVQDPAGGVFADPLRGVRREGYARAGDAVWLVAAVPAGKGAVAVGLPVDRAWAQALASAGGAEVTIAAGQPAPISTAPAADLAAVLAATRALQPRPVDAGTLPRLQTGLVPGLPPLPLLLARVPAHRVQVVALRGMKAGLAALSVPMAPAAAPIAAFQAVTLAVLVLLLAAGLVLGLLVTAEQAVGVPRELLQAADRIQRGDFAARVVPLAGSMGTVASALNRAAEAAEQGAARQGVPDLFAPPGPEASAEPDPFAAAPPPARTPPPSPTPAPAPAPEASHPDLFAAVPEPPPEPSAEPAFAPLSNSISGATSLTTRPEDLVGVAPTPAPGAAPPPVRSATPPPVRTPPPARAMPAQTPPPILSATPPPVRSATPPPARPPPAPTPAPGPAAGDPDAGHWNEVFQEFLRIRAACGESTAGLTAERFMAKLQANRTALMQKHDCHAVRFQVYVKDGRAAIKATPVK
jgi:hypothetical protein